MVLPRARGKKDDYNSAREGNLKNYHAQWRGKIKFGCHKNLMDLQGSQTNLTMTENLDATTYLAASLAMTICFFTKAQILAMTTSVDCHELPSDKSRNDEFTFDSFLDCHKSDSNESTSRNDKVDKIHSNHKAKFRYNHAFIFSTKITE